jgi:hypothetical protein
MACIAYNTHQRQFVHSDDIYFRWTRGLKVKKRLTQRAATVLDVKAVVAFYSVGKEE